LSTISKLQINSISSDLSIPSKLHLETKVDKQQIFD
jgi:hypothetical protein